MMKNNPLLFELLVKKAKVLVERFQRSERVEYLHSALESFLLADSLIDICRVSYDREATKLRFIGENKEFYDCAIHCSYLLYQITNQPEYVSVAFTFIEKSKAMILWDALSDTQIKHTIGIPDSILRIERQLKTQTAYVNSLWMEEINAEKPDDRKIAQLRADQYEIGQQQDALALVLEQHYPQYFAIKYEIDEQLLPSAKAYAAEHGATLVDYFWGKEYIYAIGIDADHSRFVQIPITDSLMYTFTTYQLAIQHRPSQTLLQTRVPSLHHRGAYPVPKPTSPATSS